MKKNTILLIILGIFLAFQFGGNQLFSVFQVEEIFSYTHIVSLDRDENIITSDNLNSCGYNIMKVSAGLSCEPNLGNRQVEYNGNNKECFPYSVTINGVTKNMFIGDTETFNGFTVEFDSLTASYSFMKRLGVVPDNVNAKFLIKVNKELFTTVIKDNPNLILLNEEYKTELEFDNNLIGFCGGVIIREQPQLVLNDFIRTELLDFPKDTIEKEVTIMSNNLGDIDYSFIPYMQLSNGQVVHFSKSSIYYKIVPQEHEPFVLLKRERGEHLGTINADEEDVITPAELEAEGISGWGFLGIGLIMLIVAIGGITFVIKRK